MAYGLNNLELAPDAELAIGEFGGWRLSASTEAVFVRPVETGGRFQPAAVVSEQVRAHLGSLESQGYCGAEHGAYLFSYTDLGSLSDEDWGLIERFCQSLPCVVELDHARNLGHPEFHLQVTFRIGGRRVYPELIGPFAKLEGEVYLLAAEVRELLGQVSALNALPAEEKSRLDKVLAKWASVDRAADGAGARVDHYLAGESVVVPEKVIIDMVEDTEGNVSVVPSFANVADESMHHAYLRENDVHGVYHTDSNSGGRVRVVLTPEVKTAIEAVKQYRKLSPKERDQLFTHPEELLPDGIDPNVIDLSRYGPRVRAIGEYPVTVRPFVTERRPWADVGESGDESDTIGRSGPESAEVGLEMAFEDGSSSRECFDRASEAEELLEAIDHAIAKGEPVVEFRGKKMRAGARIRDAVGQCVDAFDKQDRNKDAAKPDSVKETTGSGIRGPLVYENVEASEYGEDDQEVVDRSFSYPRSLLPHVKLKPHQEVGVRWLVDTVLSGKRGSLLADDMGLGKTLQALVFLAWLIENDPLETGLSAPTGPWEPILVVAPVILLEVWTTELRAFFNDSEFLPYEILDSSALGRLRKEKGREGKLDRSVLDLDRIRQNRLVISNYETVANYGFSFAQIPWTAVVTDESHKFKEPSTRVSQVMKTLNTRFRIAMTGTPVVNRLLDVWNLVDFLRPLHLETQKEFRNTYELKTEDGGPLEGARRLNSALRVATKPPVTADCVVLRRSKAQELPGLPEKHEVSLDCPLSAAQRSAYVDLVAAISAESGQGKMFKLLASLNKLLQHPALVGLLPLDSTTDALVAASPKVQALIAALRKVAAKGEKALVFAITIDVQHLLKRVLDAEFGLDVDIINGQTSEAGARVRRRRLDLIDKFCAGDGFDVMVLSPDVAGVGLTITAANHVFHFGRWWNPAREDQATDRTYRIGQERSVYVYRLVATDPEGKIKTFDEHLDDLISERRRTSEHFLMPTAGEDELGQNLGGRVLGDNDEELPDSQPMDSTDTLVALTPDRFEALVASWFEKRGYAAFLTPYTNDAGVDVLAINESEVCCVQVKHVARKGGKVDEKAVLQVLNGSSHYYVDVLPKSLGARRRRMLVVTNGRASRKLDGAAAKAGVEFVGASALTKDLRALGITTADVAARELGRCASLRTLKVDLAKAYGLADLVA
jgi:hypothetical protein